MGFARSRWGCLAAGAAILLVSQSVLADADTIEEVVVTAQKRPESLAEVPAAISVVSGAQLQAAGINNAESLQDVVPSLTFKKGTTNLNSTLSIRGIGTQSFASGAEPSVATVVDGVVMGRSGMAFTEFTDISRIEVLQGPQGTLFGKNASAGVINMVTRDPGTSFEGNASASYFENREYRAGVDLSGPLSDQVGFTLSALYGNYDGNIKNVFNDQWTGGYRREGVRGKLVAQLTDSLKFTLAADYVHANDDCCADILGAYVPSAQLTNILLPSIAPVVAGPRNNKIDNDLSPLTIDTNTGTSAQFDWQLGDYTVTSISAFRRWYNYQQRDGDFHASFSNYVASLDLRQHDHGALTFKQYSEELRLASPTHRFFEYVVGAFFWHTDEQDWFTRDDNQCTASTLPADATGFKPCAPASSTYLITRGAANWDTKFDNQALFGQGTANITNQFRMIAGGRFTHDKVSYDLDRVDEPVPGPGVGGPFSGSGSTIHNGWSAKAGLQYDFAQDLMGYATYSRGYKGPAINVFFNMTALNAAPIAPETSNAYEIGLKSGFFDRHLVLNLAAYREDFDNFQTNSFVLINGSVTTSLTNAGTVRSEGVTADFNWLPLEGLSIVGGYAYDKATIVDYLCAGQTGAALLSCQLVHNGATLPFAPKNKFNVTPSWLLPLGNSLPFTTRLTASYVYTSAINFDIDQTPLARQPGYGLLGASIEFATLDDKYHLSLIGRNLTDKFYTNFITPVGNGVAAGSYARLQVPRDAQRYFGVTVAAKF
jgi:iron complex outermembrane receptor protein